MRAGWQRLGIGWKQVRKIPAMTAVSLGQSRPEAAGRGRVGPAPKPRCVGWPVPRPATARPCAACGPQTVTSQPVLTLPTGCAAPFSAAGGARAGALAALFGQFGHSHAGHAGHARNAALRIALGQQLFHLGVTGRPLGSSRHKLGLVAAGLALVAGVPAAVPVAPNMLAAATGTKVLSNHHQPNT